MVHIIFVEPSGNRKQVEAEAGNTLMRAAFNNGIEQIVAECGGCLSCATCHAYIHPAWVDRLPPPAADEKAMLDCAVKLRPNSRLTCQIKLTEGLDGLVVELPASQF